MRATILALLLGGCATCDDVAVQPPAQYDHAPTRLYTTRELPLAEVLERCSNAEACTYGNAGVIYIPQEVSQEEKSCLLRHEYGHINGWPADHPA